jgi:hypothetical protein
VAKPVDIRRLDGHSQFKRFRGLAHLLQYPPGARIGDTF